MSIITDEKNITITEIQNIYNHCLKLLTYTESLKRVQKTEEAYSFTEDILKSMRKLSVASMMYERKLICISGLQGAGKTTLIKNFYNIDDKYFNITRGRGERIPILITEKKKISVPEMHSIKINKNNSGEYIKEDIKLSAEEFIKASTGKDKEIMYLELYVPYKHIYNEGVSFILLPGFEKKNEYWNNLIEFSITSSDSAVFVFNQTSFSNSDNDLYLNMLKEIFGKNLIYVISGADGSADNNESVKKTCMEVLNVPSYEADRVVCVGAYSNPKDNKIWIENFKKSLEKYVYKENQNLKNNSTYLYNEVITIKNTLYQILNILNDYDNEQEFKDYHNDGMLKEFDKVVKKKRKIFEANLDEQFEKAKSESEKNLERIFSNRPKSKYAKRFLFGSTVNEQFIEPRKTVEESLKCEKNLYLPNKYLEFALEESLKSLDGVNRSNNKNYIKRLVNTVKQNNDKVLLVDDDTNMNLMEDINTLLKERSKEPIKSNDPKKVLRAMAEVTIYYFSLKNYNSIAENIGLNYYEPAQTNIISGDIVEGARSSKTFIAGMAGIMGVDIIGDGSLNMISQIATSLGIAIPIAGVATIAIVGAGATSVVLKDINRMQREDFYSAKLAIHSVYDNLKEKVLESYDADMEKVRDIMEDNLTSLSRDGKIIKSLYNAKVEVNNLLDLLDDISGRYAGDVYGLESAFS